MSTWNPHLRHNKAFQNKNQIPREAVFGDNHERLDLSPNVRKVIHQQKRILWTGIGPLIASSGFIFTALYYFVPQENQMFVHLYLY